MNFGASFGGGGSFFGGASDALVGGSGTQQTNTAESSVTSKSGSKYKQLNLSETAIQQIVTDTLSGDSGLAAIFGQEQQAGLFNTSVASNQASDLTSSLVAELAKLTSKQAISEEEGESTAGVNLSTTEASKDSVIDNILGNF